MMKSLLAVATAAVLAAPALAQTPTAPTQPKPMAEEAFAKFDNDKNKALSKAEFGKWMEASMTPPASKPG